MIDVSRRLGRVIVGVLILTVLFLPVNLRAHNQATTRLGNLFIDAKAASEITKEKVESLLKLGADPTARLRDGATMVHHAARLGHADAISLFIDKTNVFIVRDLEDKQRKTPFQWAVESDQMKAFGIFRDRSAFRLSVKHADGLNLAEIAKKNNNRELADELYKMIEADKIGRQEVLMAMENSARVTSSGQKAGTGTIVKSDNTSNKKPPYLLCFFVGTTAVLLVYEAYRHKVFPWQVSDEVGEDEEESLMDAKFTLW